MRRELMNDPSSSGSGIERGWNTEERTSMGWTEHTLEYNMEINPNRNEFGTGILCALRFIRSGKLSNAASLLMDIKDSGLQIGEFYMMHKYFNRRGYYAECTVVYMQY